MIEPNMNAVSDLVAAFTRRMDTISRQDQVFKDAIATVKLGENAVRIGSWDILYEVVSGRRVYSIRSAMSGEISLRGICFYDTAVRIVGLLNRGMAPQSVDVKRIVHSNDAFARARDEAEFQLSRARYYEENSIYDKAENAMALHDYYYDKSQSFYSSFAG